MFSIFNNNNRVKLCFCFAIPQINVVCYSWLNGGYVGYGMQLAGMWFDVMGVNVTSADWLSGPVFYTFPFDGSLGNVTSFYQ